MTGPWPSGYYVTPALALIVLGIRLRKGGTAAEWTLTAFLIAAFAVSVWQVRGATFSVPLAAIALAAWVGAWRQRISRDGGPDQSMLRMASGLAGFPELRLDRSRPMRRRRPWESEARHPQPSRPTTCERPADYAQLAAQPFSDCSLLVNRLGQGLDPGQPQPACNPMILDIARLLLFPALMAFAAASDLFTMTISNRVSLALVAGFLALALLGGMGLHDILLHFGAGATVLVVAFACFAMGWVGGGDAKVAAAAALWFGFEPSPRTICSTPRCSAGR